MLATDLYSKTHSLGGWVLARFGQWCSKAIPRLPQKEVTQADVPGMCSWCKEDVANNLCTLQEAVYANDVLYTAQPEFAQANLC